MGIRRRAVVAGLLGYAVTAAHAPGMTPEASEPSVGPASGPTAALVAPAAPDAAGTVAMPLVPRIEPAGLPTWRRFAIQPKPADGRPVVAIVIDDLGDLRIGTERAVALPGPLTLAWFPFARNLAEQVAVATARGHETLLHMPMQSFGNGTYLTGPDPLRIDLTPDINLARLRAAIAAVPDAVGLNNHMGSVATKNAALMGLVAAETRRHGMLFVDSMVIPHSQGLPCALEAGVPAAGNDIFLDPIHSTDTVFEQLERAEKIAHHRGYVIAIGHPHPKTLDGLAAWLPTVEAKGLVLWPVSAAVAFRNRMDIAGLG